MGHVYLIGSEKYRWYKIGKSADARIRVLNLGILLPFKIGIIQVIRCERYSFVETALHEKFAEYRVNGEWFYFIPAVVNQVCRDMELLGIPVVGVAGFHNREHDLTPDGREPKVKFKIHVPQEECNRRRELGILENKLRKAAKMAGFNLRTLEQAKVLAKI